MDLLCSCVNEAQTNEAGPPHRRKSCVLNCMPHKPSQLHARSTKQLKQSFKTIQEDKCWSWGTTYTLTGAPQHCLSTQPFTSWKSFILLSLFEEWCDDELPKRHSKEALHNPVSSDCLMFVRPELCWKETLWVMDSLAVSTWARLHSCSMCRLLHCIMDEVVLPADT